MEALLVLLLLYLFAAVVIFPIWAMVKIGSLDTLVQHLRATISDLQLQIGQLRKAPPAKPDVATDAAAAAPLVVPSATTITAQPEPLVAPQPPPVPTVELPVAPAIAAPKPDSAPPLLPPVIAAAAVVPPPIPANAPTPHATPAFASAPSASPASTPPPAPRTINWEHFMGAKLFAWLGGIALFLSVLYFIKYSFDQGWIAKEVRAAAGFVFGAGLIVGGLRINRERYAITAQTLIATGVVSLYAVTFACRAVYHFAFFGVIPTFVLMVLITTTAFLLAVRLRAQVIALLGMLGGFLTPILLSTGVDNPGGLFGYLALLDLGLTAVALRMGWLYLIPLGAGGTALMMWGWADKFLTAEKGPTAMIITLAFSVLYLVANAVARRRQKGHDILRWTAVAMPLVGFTFAFWFLDFPELAERAPLYLGFVLLLDALLLTLAWTEEKMSKVPLLAGGIAFLLLACWTGQYLLQETLPWALAFYLGFAVLHTVFPLVLQRRRPDTDVTRWSHVFPPLALLLMLLPIVRLDETSFLLWPAILLVDILAIALAAMSASLIAVAAVLVLTLIATGCFLFHIPVATALDGSFLAVVGGFGIFFFAASAWLVRRLGANLPKEKANGLFGDARGQLPAFSALLPFILLIMASARLAVPDPSMLFGLALLLVVLTLGVATILTIEWLPLCALIGVVGLEFAWSTRHFSADSPTIPLAWHLGFTLLFAVFPFLFRSRFLRQTGPWAVAALASIAHFPLVYRAVNLAWPNEVMGLLPAAFAVIPLLSLVMIARAPSADPAKRLNQLAWFGATALLFITLIFPIQFDRQWLTISWALEGVALLWLFHRVPHGGLRGTGLVLLGTVFVRLILNGAVLSYHVRGETPLLNWYLYTYGIATLAMFFGAKLLAPPRERALGIKAPPLLNTLGVILAFVLLNIEIADYFTPVGATTLSFRFTGTLGRGMTYTIAWSVFALVLLVMGIWKQAKAARYAAIALLCVALFKLFFNDLARLQALYRIGALFVVAIVAIIASVAYQRFLPSNAKTPPPTP